MSVSLNLLILALGIILGFLITSFLINLALKKRASEIQRDISMFNQNLPDVFVRMNSGFPFRRLNVLLKKLSNSFRDLTGQLKQLKAQVNDAHIVFDKVFEGVIGVDRNRRILLHNQNAVRMVGYQHGQAHGKSVLETVRNSEMDDMLRLAMETNTCLQSEIKLFQPKEIILQVQAIGIRGNSDLQGMMVFQDLTETRKLETIRRDFVANVSHELKTPLTSLKGVIETLAAGAWQDPEKCRSFLQIMEEDTSRLERLIADLLELSKIESQEVSLKFESLDLRTEIAKAISLFAAQAQVKKLRIENRISESLPKILADRNSLRQVLINLIDNGVKFNREGGSLTFHAKISTNDNVVHIDVEDTGIGIPKKDLPRIFERFFRVDKARSRELGGTGLGLSIVKHIIEAHGGTVSCQSEIERGSIFSITIPLAMRQSV